MPPQTEWTAYFTSLTVFAGVVFAIVLAARLQSHRADATQGLLESDHDLWDSLAVTYELAAAGILGSLFIIRGTLVGAIFGTIVAGVGLWLDFRYVRAFLRLPKSSRSRRRDTVLGFSTILPILALLWSAVALWLGIWLPSDALDAWFAAAVTWLVISGTLQALIWYTSGWRNTSGGNLTEAEDQT